MNLLGNTKSKITKDRNGENVPHLDNIVKNIVYICSKQTIWWFIRNSTNKPYLFRNI